MGDRDLHLNGARDFARLLLAVEPVQLDAKWNAAPATELAEPEQHLAQEVVASHLVACTWACAWSRDGSLNQGPVGPDGLSMRKGA